MIIPYIGVVLLVTLLFFVIYIYAVRKLDIFSANLKMIVAMCLISIVISVLLPLVYVYYGYMAVAVLLIILTGCSVFTANMLIGHKSAVVCGTLKDSDSGWHKCLAHGIESLFRNFAKTRQRPDTPREANEILQMANSEDMNAFKFIISNASNNKSDEIKELETQSDPEQELVSDGQTCDDKEEKAETGEIDVSGDKDLTEEELGNIDDILEEIDGVEEEDIEALLGELEEEALHEEALHEEAPHDEVLHEEAPHDESRSHDHAGDERENSGNLSESSFDIYRNNVNEKYVDSEENIDKMRVESNTESASYQSEDDKSSHKDPDFQSLDALKPTTIEECIDKAFSLKQAGNMEEAILYYMYALDKDCPRDLALMILLDMCAMYKQLGKPEAAKNLLEGYLSKFNGAIESETKCEIEKNL